MILLIDNYDSFTYNLAHLFQELGAEVTVIRNDAIDPDHAERLAPTHLVVSPGPGEMTRWEGSSSSAASASIASLRMTVTSAPSSWNRCARL